MRKWFLALAYILCSLFSLNARQKSGEILINEVFHQVPLAKVLNKIKNRYSITIAYDNQAVEDILVDVVLVDATIEECFEKILQGTPLEFIRVGGNIVISKRLVKSVSPTRFNFRLAGKVRDQETGETLPNVFVRIVGTTLVTTSNNDGYFTFFQVPNDTLILDVRHLGYIGRSIRLSEVTDPLSIVISIKDELKILESVVVTDEYNQPVQTNVGAGELAFNPKSVRYLPSLGEHDVFRTMQLLPGISGTDESSSGMSIRGMHSSENLVLLDGIIIYQFDHLFGAFSSLNSDIIKDVQISKGNFDAKYGGRVSGVAEITSKNGNTEKPAFHVGANSISLRALAEIPVTKKISLMMAGRRSYTDFIQSSQFKDLYTIGLQANDQVRLFSNPFQLFSSYRVNPPTPPSYFFYDGNAKLSYRPTSRDVISVSKYISKDRLHINDSTLVGFEPGVIFFKMYTREQTVWGNNGLSMRWGRQWNEKFHSNVRVSDSRYYRKDNFYTLTVADSLQDTTHYQLTNGIHDISLAIDNEWSINDHMSLSGGLSNLQQKVEVYIYQKTFDEPEGGSDQVQKGWLTSIYGTFNATFVDRLNLSLGMRANHFQVNQQIYLEPKAMMNYELSEKVNFKMAYGVSNQFINQLMIDPPPSQLTVNINYWQLSDKSRYIPVLNTHHYTVGATLKTKEITLDGEFYFKKNTGIMDSDLTDGKSLVTGLDVMVQKTAGIYKGWIAYSWRNSRQSFSYFDNGKFYPTLLDQRHEIKVVNTIKLYKWNFSSIWIYGSGRPFPVYSINSFSGIFSRDYTNPLRLPAYHRLDISAGYQFKVGGRMEFEMGLSLFNVYNKRNLKTRKVNLGIPDIFENVHPGYADVSLLGFTPNLFLNVSF